MKNFFDPRDDDDQPIQNPDEVCVEHDEPECEVCAGFIDPEPTTVLGDHLKGEE